MKKSLEEESPTDFTSYRYGYNDGYFGEEMKFPSNSYYSMGYQDGKEADRAGAPNKFSNKEG